MFTQSKPFLFFLTLAALLSTTLWAENHKTDIGFAPRPPASVNDVSSGYVPSMGLVAYDTIYRRVPAISSKRIGPGNSKEKVAWEQKLETWKTVKSETLSKIQHLLKLADKNPSLISKNVTAALKQMEISFTQAKKDVGEQFFGGSIVSDPAHHLSQEITDLFLAYSEAYLEISEDSSLSKKQIQERAHYSVIQQMSDASQPNTPQTFSSEHQENLKHLLNLRDYLRQKGNFEAFARKFIEGYRRNFRSPNQTS